MKISKFELLWTSQELAVQYSTYFFRMYLRAVFSSQLGWSLFCSHYKTRSIGRLKRRSPFHVWWKKKNSKRKLQMRTFSQKNYVDCALYSRATASSWLQLTTYFSDHLAARKNSLLEKCLILVRLDCSYRTRKTRKKCTFPRQPIQIF
jgi:hypothetical protein